MHCYHAPCTRGAEFYQDQEPVRRSPWWDGKNGKACRTTPVGISGNVGVSVDRVEVHQGKGGDDTVFSDKADGERTRKNGSDGKGTVLSENRRGTN